MKPVAEAVLSTFSSQTVESIYCPWKAVTGVSVGLRRYLPGRLETSICRAAGLLRGRQWGTYSAFERWLEDLVEKKHLSDRPLAMRMALSGQSSGAAGKLTIDSIYGATSRSHTVTERPLSITTVTVTSDAIGSTVGGCAGRMRQLPNPGCARRLQLVLCHRDCPRPADHTPTCTVLLSDSRYGKFPRLAMAQAEGDLREPASSGPLGSVPSQKRVSSAGTAAGH